MFLYRVSNKPTICVPRVCPRPPLEGDVLRNRFAFSQSRFAKFTAPAEGRNVLTDTETKGLVCRVTSDGVKTLGVRGRIKGGDTFWINFRDPSLRSISEWREKARAMMAKARDGIDPRISDEENLTFAEARDRYLAEPPPVSRGARMGQPWSAAHKREVTRYLTKCVDSLEPIKLRLIKKAHLARALDAGLPLIMGPVALRE